MERYVSAVASRAPLIAALLVCATNSAAFGQALPSPWTAADIGAPALSGSASYKSDVFRIDAAGTDIWDTGDQFHFVHQPMSGNGEVVARVVSLVDTDEWAKAGVMIRESLTSQSRHVMVAMTSSQGYAFQSVRNPPRRACTPVVAQAPSQGGSGSFARAICLKPIGPPTVPRGRESGQTLYRWARRCMPVWP